MLANIKSVGMVDETLFDSKALNGLRGMMAVHLVLHHFFVYSRLPFYDGHHWHLFGEASF